MPLQHQEINPSTDFPSLTRCMFESYANPSQSFFHIFFPIHGSSTQAREDAIAEAATRLKLWHTSDRASHWRKVVDTENGKIAGGALWKIHKEDPFASPTPLDATWFPDDGSRLFANEVVKTHSGPRSRVASKPHVYLFIIFTHPAYRRKGVGQSLLSWGVEQADNLDYELFLEATPYGRPLYEKNGLVYIEEYANHPQTGDPDEAWKGVDRKVGSFTFWLMKRPALGMATADEKTKLVAEN